MRLLFIVATALVLFVSLSLFFFEKTRKTYPGFRLWISGLTLIGVGVGFFSLRGHLPDFIAIPGANLVVPLGAMLQLAGMRAFLGFKPMPRIWFVFFAAIVIASSVAYLVYNSLPLFSLVGAIGISAPHFAMALLILSPPVRRESVFFVVIASFLAWGGVMILVRSLWAFSRPDFHLFLDSPLHYFIFICLIISLLGENLAFLALNAERLEKELLSSEETIKERERFLTTIIENIPDMIFIRDAKELRVVNINKAAEDLLGYQRDRIIGATVHDVLSKEDADFCMLSDREILRTGIMKDLPAERILTKEKGTRIIHTKKIPLYDKHGNAQYVLGISEDITERKQADDAIRASEQRFKLMFQKHDAIMLLIDPGTGRIIDANRSALRFYGYTETEILQMTINEINAQSAEEINREMRKAVSEERNRFIFPHRLSNGEVRTVEVHSSPIEHEGEQVLFSIIYDITDRQEALESLRKSEDKYRLLTEHSLTGIFIHQDGALVFGNQRLADMLGYTREEAMGRNYLDFVHPEDRKMTAGKASSRLQGKLRSTPYEMRLMTKTGEAIWCEVLATRTDYHGRPAIIGNLADITERKKAEEALQKQHEIQRTLLSAIPAYVYFKDTNSVYMHGNARFAELCRTLEGEISGKTDYDLFPREIASTFRRQDAEVLATGKSKLNHEERGTDGQGNTIWFSTSKSPFYGHYGEIAGLVGISIDITEHREAREALKKSENKHRRVFENLQDVYLETLYDGTITEVSPSVNALLGFSRDELVGHSVLKIYKDTGERESFVTKLSQDGVARDYEITLKSKHGEEILCSSNSRLIFDEFTNVRHVCGVIRDIRERKRAETLLRTTFERFYDILSSLSVGVLLVTEEDRIEFANQAFCDLFDLRLSPDSLHGLTARELLANIKDVYHQPSEALKRVQKIVDLQLPVKDEEIAIQGGRTYLRDFIPIFINGNRYGRLWSHQDVTELKRTEERIKASLREKEVLLREVHHRVKNNFQIVAGLLSLQSDYVHDGTHQIALKEAEARVLAMARVHERLYQSIDLEKIRLDEYLTELAQELIGFSGYENARIRLVTEMAPVTSDIDNAICCGLILTELVTNSLKHAFNEGAQGLVNVTLGRISEHERELIVRDNGKGFPENRTLENTASLGLKLVQAFVKNLRGEVTLERDRGTALKIRFKDRSDTAVIES